MRTSTEVNKIFPALLKVKAELGSVTKNTTNTFFKSNYADLNSYLEEVEPLLEKNGLLLLQPINSSEILNKDTVQSIIIDATSGQYVLSEMTVVAKENDMQKLGSAVTYARRYTLGSLLGMKAEDDDGNSAAGKVKEEKKVVEKRNDTVTINAKDIKNTSLPEQTTAPIAVQSGTTLTTNKPSFRKPKKETNPEVAKTVADPGPKQITTNDQDGF